MTVVKFAALGLCFSLTILILKNVSKDFAVYASIAAACVMLFFIVESVFSVWSKIRDLFDGLPVPTELLTAALKVLGIGYLTEFSAGISADAGEKSIADKVRLFGKLAIFSACIPILKQFLITVSELL